jgi:hypothetical protein
VIALIKSQSLLQEAALCIAYTIWRMPLRSPAFFVPANCLSRSRLDLIQLYARAPSKVILIVNGLGYPPLRSPWLRRGLPLCCDTQESRCIYCDCLGVCSGAVALVIYFSRYPFSHGNRPNHENTGGRRHPFYTRDVFIQHGHFSHQIYTIKSFNRRYPSSSVFAEVKSDTLFCGLPFSDRSHCLRW